VPGLSAAAVDDYILLGLHLPQRMGASPDLLLSRTAALSELTQLDGDQRLYVERLLDRAAGVEYIDEWHGHEQPWWELDEEADPRSSAEEYEIGYVEDDVPDGPSVTRPVTQAEAATSRRGDGPSLPMALYVTNSGQHGLRRAWLFHPYDEDPYPSVPHGHERLTCGAGLKLDVYRGHHLRGKRIEGREKRKAIQALWNSDPWRAFAKSALLCALAHDETLKSRLMDERGIRRPLRLPRKR